ncbi:hypothetical protein DITRI_Ditri17bG0045000 [Diplodiscus trichospermus]
MLNLQVNHVYRVQWRCKRSYKKQVFSGQMITYSVRQLARNCMFQDPLEVLSLFCVGLSPSTYRFSALFNHALQIKGGQNACSVLAGLCFVGSIPCLELAGCN